MAVSGGGGTGARGFRRHFVMHDDQRTTGKSHQWEIALPFLFSSPAIRTESRGECRESSKLISSRAYALPSHGETRDTNGRPGETKRRLKGDVGSHGTQRCWSASLLYLWVNSTKVWSKPTDKRVPKLMGDLKNSRSNIFKELPKRMSVGNLNSHKRSYFSNLGRNVFSRN